MLKEVISNMPEEDAKYHMKRCVDSGLWVADANANEHGLVETSAGDPKASTATAPATDDLDLD